MRGSADYAFLRYWVEGRTRWKVEIPPDPDRGRVRLAEPDTPVRLRFTAPDGVIRWARSAGSKRLADFTNRELQHLRESSASGPFTRI